MVCGRKEKEMKNEDYIELMKIYKTSAKTIDRVCEIFSGGDKRYVDLEYEIIVAGFLDNGAISIREKPIETEAKSKEDIKGPQKDLKALALKLLEDYDFKLVAFERGFAGGIADIIAKGNGKNIIIECGPCNLIKAIDYLSVENTILWILKADVLYIIERYKDWGSFYRFHESNQEEKNKKIMSSINFFDSNFRRKIPRTLTEEEIGEMLRYSEDNKRDNMLMKCMYFLGLKNTEVQNLRGEDFDFEKSIVKIRGRSIPIPEDFLKEILKWKKEGPLFSGRSNGLISDRHIRRIAKKYAELAGVRKYEEIHPHTLRHSYATHLQNNGTPLNVIQALLGHSRIETTTIYTHLGIENLKREVDKVFK